MKRAGWAEDGEVLSLARYLFPVLIFLGLFHLTRQDIQGIGDGLHFFDDDSYAACVLAEQVQAGEGYGLDANQVAPMNRSAPAAFILAGVNKITGEPAVSVQILGMVWGILTLLVMAHFGPRYEQSEGARCVAVLTAATLPVLMTSALEANGHGLFVLLVTLGILRFWRRRQRGESGFGFTSFTPLALAATLHIEVIAILMWMGVSECFNGRHARLQMKNILGVWLHVLCGVLWAGIFLAPLVLHHLREFSVPWPRYYDAATSVSAGGELMGTMPSAQGSGMFHLLFQDGGLHMLWPGGLLIAALVSGLLLWLLDKDHVPLVDLLTLTCLPPVLVQGLSAVTGHEGASILLGSVTPALVFLSVLTCARAFTRIWKKCSLPTPAWKGMALPALLAGVFLILVAGLNSMIQNKHRVSHLSEIVDERNQVLAVLADQKGAIFTDRPGWLSWAQDEAVVDVRGKYSPAVLARMDARGQLELDEWDAVINQFEIDHCVIASDAMNQTLHDVGMLDGQADTSGIRVWIRWTPAAL